MLMLEIWTSLTATQKRHLLLANDMNLFSMSYAEHTTSFDSGGRAIPKLL